MGQNFLIDRNVLQKIIKASQLSKQDIVLEIGPGLGILTKELAKNSKEVIAVEKDKIMAQTLEKILTENKINNVKIINKDILKVFNFQFSIFKKISKAKYKLVANLPYYITSPVIRKFLEIKNKPQSMILMVQKEVAQRICANPPRMSILSISVQSYADVKIIDYISKDSFFPKPKVDSAIIKIIPKKKPEINTKKFFEVVKTGFSFKRKFLIKNLSRKFKNQDLERIFEQIGINQKSRAENLSIKNWFDLFHKIYLD